jgi:hypothetical protein
MASIIQRRLAKAGLTKQTAKGSIASAATFGYGIDGGSIAKLELTENEIPLTWSNRDILGFDRSGIKPGQDIGTVATPNLIGLLLLGILGADSAVATTTTISAVTSSGSAPNIVATVTTGTQTPPIKVGQSVTIAGVGGATQVNGTFLVASVVDPTHFTLNMGSTTVSAYTSGGTVNILTTHTITPSPTLPYLTAFGLFGTADFMSLGDSKVSSLELSWEAAGKVSVKHQLSSITPAFLASAYTETNNEVLTTVGYLTAGGGLFQVEGVTFSVSGGSIKIDTHINQPISSATVLPADVVEGKLQTDWSLKILPTDTGLFREVFYGVGTAGALSGVVAFPRLGAVSCNFQGSYNDQLTISSPAVRFMVEFPEAAPDGGPSELTLAGTSTLPTSGASVTAVLANQTASY